MTAFRFSIGAACCALVLVSPPAAHAAKTLLRAGTLPPLVQPQIYPIDVAQDHLYKKNRTKVGAYLKRAYDALQEHKTAETRALARKVAKDRAFADYSFWLQAGADRADAMRLLESGKYQNAITTAKRAASLELRIQEGYPYSPFVRLLPKDLAQSELTIGNAFWGMKRARQAQESFENAFSRLVTVNGMALVHPEDLESYSAACVAHASELCSVWVQRFSQTYARESEEIKAIALSIPDVAERAQPARPIGHATQNYRAPDLDQTAFDGCMKFYLASKYKQAVNSFREFLDEFPKSTHRYRARYWLAQSLSHLQRHDEARTLYDELQHDTPISYYGLLAALANGSSLESCIGATLPDAELTDPFLQPQDTLHVHRAEKLLASNARELAALELRDVRVHEPYADSFLMYLAMLNSEARNYVGSFVILSELAQRNFDGVHSSFALRMIFPLGYLDLVKKYSSENGLDPLLVLSLIKQESAFDAGANSSAGAAGLMQLMPATAVDTIPDISRADLTDADSNIRVGTKYLSKLLARFNGNIVLALAAYNAGPNAVDRWTRDTPPGQWGLQEFLELIPYKETREYVGSIIRNYFWYSRKLTGDTPKSLGYFWNVYGPPEKPPNLQSRTGK